jgi:hypothetical protein
MVSDERTELGKALAQRLAPDVALSPPSTDFGLRASPHGRADVYFVREHGNRPLRLTPLFRVQGMAAEWWNSSDRTISLRRRCEPAPPRWTTIAA